MDSKIIDWAEKKNEVFYCKLCNVQLKASSGRTDLLTHAESKKHIAAAKSVSIKKNR